jgi:hypothetical protein
MRDLWLKGPGWLPDLDQSVSLLDGLATADLADSPAAEAEWAPAAVPGLITGFLFSGQAWTGGQEVVPAAGHPRRNRAGAEPWAEAEAAQLKAGKETET